MMSLCTLIDNEGNGELMARFNGHIAVITDPPFLTCTSIC